MPDPPRVEAALGRVPLRVHQDIVLTSQMFVDGDDVILLPAATRYEQEGGGTSTTTERQIAFSPQVAGPVGEARSEWRIFADLASRVRPDLAARFDWDDNRSLRAEIGELVPTYAGIEDLEQVGDAVQYGGRHLCVGGRFPTPSGRGQFSVLDRGADRARTRRVVRVDAPRQAVQLDGAGGHRSAHRRRTRRGVHRRARRRRARRRRRRPDHPAQPGGPLRRPGQARAAAGADLAGALAGGQRAARRRRRPPRADESGARLQRRRHHRGGRA